MKRDSDQFFAIDTSAAINGAAMPRSWLPATDVRTVAIDPRRWQSRAARGYSWHARGNGQGRPGKQPTLST
jgi:hypothetical protein